jgi:hypothetical protein
VENLPSTPVKIKFSKIVTLEIEQEVWNGGDWRFVKREIVREKLESSYNP